MAQKKSGGSSRNGRESNPKYLGFKKFFGNFINPGCIILRQKGNVFYSGLNTSIGKDYTIYSLIFGYIFLKKKNKKKIIYVL
ncbi:50S ribosomal protein L27 [Candidatus Nasuia deltocephalinicola]|uniref:50S ribosomal protein L27 n=1 Tax=Candidatus Nasuia deltocephalincola TaxID=1160784 RepID=UPI00216B3AFD|nr:bL27 family ribosomal protein [Candidatus Nasuia deltocephalinicola]